MSRYYEVGALPYSQAAGSVHHTQDRRLVHATDVTVNAAVYVATFRPQQGM